MSGRVVKNVQKFRPVARARPRPTETSEGISNSIESFNKNHLPVVAQNHQTDSNLQFDGTSVNTIQDDICRSPRQEQNHLPQRNLQVGEAAPQDPSTDLNSQLYSLKSNTPPIIEGCEIDGQSIEPLTEPSPLHPSTDTRSTSGPPKSGEITLEKRKRGNLSSLPQKKKRRRSGSRLDTQLDPGEPLDPTTVTMKDLCGETSFGRVSSRYVEVQEAHIRARKAERERRAHIARIREAKEKRGEDFDNPDIPLDLPPAAQLLANTLENNAAKEDEFHYGETMKTSHFAVAMRMDASGQMVLDEESLMVDRGADPEIVQNEALMEHIEETDISRFVNSATHSRKLKGNRWTREETELFYEALQQYNTDFTMVSLILPGRSARECRNKFNSEDKKNPDRVNWALKNPLPINLELLSQMTGKSFQGPHAAAGSPKLAVNLSSNSAEEPTVQLATGSRAEVVSGESRRPDTPLPIAHS